MIGLYELLGNPTTYNKSNQIKSIIAIYFIFYFAEILKTFFSDLITHRNKYSE
jgi:hypothetical protein